MILYNYKNEFGEQHELWNSVWEKFIIEEYELWDDDFIFTETNLKDVLNGQTFSCTGYRNKDNPRYEMSHTINIELLFKNDKYAIIERTDTIDDDGIIEYKYLYKIEF